MKNNNNRGNQVGGGNALANVYAVGHAGTNPDSNVVTVPRHVIDNMENSHGPHKIESLNIGPDSPKSPMEIRPIFRSCWEGTRATIKVRALVMTIRFDISHTNSWMLNTEARKPKNIKNEDAGGMLVKILKIRRNLEQKSWNLTQMELYASMAGVGYHVMAI
ncbi:hypothetical protein Tco_0436238 [Tanacetum coccineum]